MSAPTEAEIALAVRGALWCRWIRDGGGHLGGVARDRLLDAPALFVALLDKCDAERIEVAFDNGDATEGEWNAIVNADAGWHENRTVALLLALDAAGALPPLPEGGA